MKVVKQIHDKQQQKTVMFYNRDLINAITEEEAAAENTNPSVVIEKCVLAQLMPEDENLKVDLADAYVGETSVQQVLINVCSNLATYGMDRKRTVENRELVELIRKVLDGKVPNLETNPQFFGTYDRTYLNGNVESVISYLQKKHPENADEKFLCEIWKNQYENIPTDSPHWYRALFNMLLSSWEDIYMLTATYKVLMEICKTSDESSFEKMSLYELRSLLCSIEKSWK